MARPTPASTPTAIADFQRIGAGAANGLQQPQRGVSGDRPGGHGPCARTPTTPAGNVRTIQNYIPPSPLSPGEGVCSTAFMRNPGDIPSEAGTTSAGWGPARWSAAPATTGPDVNVTVLTLYTPDDTVAELTAVNPATGNQTTRYLYGTTLATSAIARNDLLSSVLYPDAADAADSVQMLYNLQSEVCADAGSKRQRTPVFPRPAPPNYVRSGADARHERGRHGATDRHGLRNPRHGQRGHELW